jgi:hypothetical protein
MDTSVCSFVRAFSFRGFRSEGTDVGSSDFLGDSPPHPRFLASLGVLPLMELDHCSVVDLLFISNKEGSHIGGTSLEPLLYDGARLI